MKNLFNHPFKLTFAICFLIIATIGGACRYANYAEQKAQQTLNATVDEATNVFPIINELEASDSGNVYVEFVQRTSENSAFETFYGITAPIDAVIIKDGSHYIDMRIVDEYISGGDTLATEKFVIQHSLADTK